jgi:hypothetical protein
MEFSWGTSFEGNVAREADGKMMGKLLKMTGRLLFRNVGGKWNVGILECWNSGY